jgi:hypothetical protein
VAATDVPISFIAARNKWQVRIDRQ